MNGITDDRFEKFKQVAKEEFGVSIVKTDYSEASQMLLKELRAESENNFIKTIEGKR